MSRKTTKTIAKKAVVIDLVNMLVQSDIAYEAAIGELKDRVYRLEQKVGLAT